VGALAARNGVFRVLKERDFALLWSGQSVSSLGDGIFTIALALEALRIDHSPTGLAFVLAARAIPAVCLALGGGVVVDRVPRRLVMLVSDAVRGLAVGAIAVLIARGGLRLSELIAMSAVFGTADAFFAPASMAYVPELVPAELLVQANALSQTSSQFAQGLIGPAAGGIVVAVIGTAWSFGIDAVSFAVSSVSLFAMRARGRPSSRGDSAVAAAREGLGYVRRTRWLAASLAGAALANFFGIAPLTVLLPLLVRHSLHASALALGLVFAAGGAAGVLASLVVAHLGAPRHQVTATWAAYAAGGLGIVGMAFAPDPWVVGALSAVEVGLILYGDVLWVAMMQSLVPKEMLGRVSSLVYLFAFALGPLGILAGGAGAAAIGTRPALFVSGTVSSVICVIVVFIPGVRDPDLILRHDDGDIVTSLEADRRDGEAEVG
jgi:MFS family permease